MANTHDDLVALFMEDRFYFHGTFVDWDEVAAEVRKLLRASYKSGYTEGYRDAHYGGERRNFDGDDWSVETP